MSLVKCDCPRPISQESDSFGLVVKFWHYQLVFNTDSTQCSGVKNSALNEWFLDDWIPHTKNGVEPFPHLRARTALTDLPNAKAKAVGHIEESIAVNSHDLELSSDLLHMTAKI